MMSVTADSMSQDVRKRERETAMTGHMTLEDMTADCKQLSNIKALQRRHADQLHHEQKYMAPTSGVQQGQEAGSKKTSH